MSNLIRNCAWRERLRVVLAASAWAAVLTGAIEACSSSGADGETTDASTNQSPTEAGPASSDATTDREASPGIDADAGLLDGWVLTWSDEFAQPDGTPVDPAKWNQVVGAATSNNELEYYTGGSANAAVESGMLVITATTQGASAYTCSYGACKYTSARINTQSKFAQEYGRFEARIRVPRGQGLWPAWWMEGDDKPSVGWPDCGEIDIMENIGSTPSTDYGSMHGPGYSGAHDLTGSYSLPDGAALADDFHVYAVEWDPTGVRFFLDQVLFETRTPADVPDGDTWVYDRPFFLILNVAVGGNWPGNPDTTTSFPQTMHVDYVRVYSKAM